MTSFAHIINPVAIDETSDLFVAQPITFEAMRVAKEYAKDSVTVELYTTQYPEDHSIVPDYFRKTPDLARSVMDIGEFIQKRRLPILKDILDSLYNACDAEYFIYTNVDIGLKPEFYVTVKEFVDAGYDAFVINRRTIPNKYKEVAELPLMYSEKGLPHGGWDCFVFRRDAYPRYELGLGCLGAARIGLILISNLICFSRNFREFKNEHLTFHIGNEGAHIGPALHDFKIHNTKELIKVLEELDNVMNVYDRSTPLGKLLFELKQSRVSLRDFFDALPNPMGP
jgi:hypothetical protein